MRSRHHIRHLAIAAAALAISASAAFAPASTPTAGAPEPPVVPDSGLDRPRFDVRDELDSGGRLDLVRVRVRQLHSRLELAITSQRRWAITDLSGHPDLTSPDPQRFLCLAIRGREGALRACLGPSQTGDEPRLYAGTPDTGGVVARWRVVRRAEVTRPSPRTVAIDVPYGAFGLEPGRARIRALSAWAGPAECGSVEARRRGEDEVDPAGCRDRAPGRRFAEMKLLEPRPIACAARQHLDVVREGSPAHPWIALTFDDGPDPAYTPQVLDILRERDVKATFFMVGSQVSGYPALARRVVEAGHEVGNHSTDHLRNPSSMDLAETQRRIESATGFEPCLFRPPYGSTDGETLAAAQANDLETVTWSIDTRDWTLPGTEAIRFEALAAHVGSIIVMHDGGSPRSQTLAALPGIIHNLKHRGYRLVTVSKLLGNRQELWP